MTEWLLLMLAVLMLTVIWPLARWGTNGEGNAAVMGFWISVTAGVLGLLGVLVADVPVGSLRVWAAGAAMGVAYSVGFCMLIMHCLKIGPAGPTVTVNNLAMVSGVLFNWLWLNPQRPTLLLATGVAGVCASLLLIGLAKPANQARAGRQVSGLWLKMVMVGGAFSCVSFISQTYVGMRFPGSGNSLMFSTVCFLTSAAILLPAVMRKRHVRQSIASGTIIGVISILALTIGIAIMDYFGPEVVLPVTIATPIVLMLPIGHFFYKEHLTRSSFAGCLIAAASIVLLAYASAALKAQAAFPAGGPVH